MDKPSEIFTTLTASLTIIIIIFSILSTVTFVQLDAQQVSEPVSYYKAEGYQSLLVCEKSNSSSNGTASSLIQENKPPVIVVTSPIRGEINQIVTINASISDADGNITSIIWNQEDEFPPVNMNISQDKQSMSFIPKQNVTYVFSIEAIDNSGSTTLKSALVNVGP
jgi:dethiobiotin synthetase